MKKIDSWFVSRYSMNIYRGCSHNCVYCDGRDEKYRVSGDFAHDIRIKMNAPYLLDKELDPKRRRKPMKKGFVVLGGGVCDSYQPAEKKYGLTRKILEILEKYNYPVSILTKSTLVERDIDIIEKIRKKKQAILSMSFSTTDDYLAGILEPGVPPPSERLRTLSKFAQKGIPTGMFLLPVIPFITDSPDMIDRAVKDAKNAGVRFINFGGMTLKEGRQKAYFMEVLMKHFPDYETEYSVIYRGDKYGSAIADYYRSIDQVFDNISRKYHVPKRIPPELFRRHVEENDLVIAMLEHIDYLLKMRGFRSPYGYAAWQLSKIKEPLSCIQFELMNIKGIGKSIQKLIREILSTGNSEYYHKLERQ